MNLGYNPFLLLLALAVVLVFTTWAYRRTLPDVGRKKFWLGLMRFAALATIVFLLFRPTMQSIQEVMHPPIVAVLIDQSESLSVTGASGPDSTEAVRQLLSSLIAADLPGETRYYGFGGEAVAIAKSNLVDSLSFSQQRTNFSSALEYVRDDLQEKNLKAVVVISDGRHNTGRNPLFVAERFAAPVYTVVVGDTTIRRDVLIESIVSNDIGYVKSEIPVRVTVRSDGYDVAALSVSVSVDGEVVDNKSVRLNRQQNEATLDLAFTPQTAGFKRIRVSVTRQEGEATYRNNTDAFSVRILDSRKRILLLASGPGPDVSALAQILATNTNLDVTSVVQKSATEYYGSVDPDSISGFDLVILAGYPGPRAAPRILDKVTDAANAGTPVLFISQRSTNLAVVAAKLGSVLPASPDMIRRDYFDVTFRPTPAGDQHTIMDGIDLGLQEWQQLSPLAQNNSRWKVAPDAKVLATSSVRGIDIESPILVSLQRAGSRSIALLASGFWKWRNVPEDIQDLTVTYPRLIENAVQWLTAAEDDRPVRIAPASSIFAESDRVRFSGQVYDEANAPVPDAAVTVEVRTPDGRRIPLNMESAGNGRYQLDSPPMPAGNYTYTASADRAGVPLGTDSGSFAVGELALEFRETRSNPVLMRQISDRSGGVSIQPGEIDRLASILAANTTFVARTETIQHDTELWRRLFFLGAILCLLTAEWFLRKRSGLV